jgi:hypothetical protein
MVGDVLSSHRITVAGDKAYDDVRFVGEVGDLDATPHIARKDKSSAIDGQTTSHRGYASVSAFAKRG